jgi:hypothetical protein
MHFRNVSNARIFGKLLRSEVGCNCRCDIYSKVPRTDVRILMQLTARHSFKNTKDRRNTSENIPRNRSQQHVPMDPFQTLYTIICTYRMCIEHLLGPVLYHLHRMQNVLALFDVNLLTMYVIV